MRGIAIAAGALALLATGSPAFAAGAKTQRAVDERGGAYWTDERIAAAEPRALRGSAARVAAGEDAAARSKRTANPVMRPVGRPDTPPQLGTGKLLMRFGRQASECSGSILDTPKGNVVWTAAHCVRDPGPFGGWARNVVFIPSYDRGERPFGTWRAKELHIMRGWTQWNQKLDMAAIVLRPKDGDGVREAVGAAYPLKVRPATRQRWHAIGYPAANRFGDRMWECMSGRRARDRIMLRRRGPQPIGIACGMGGGTSGGPWLTRGGAIGAVSSYRVPRLKQRLFGAVVGLEARRLARRVGWRKARETG